MKIKDENYRIADTKLAEVSIAIATVRCLAECIEKHHGIDSYEAEAMHFIADYLDREIEDLEELLFGDGARE